MNATKKEQSLGTCWTWLLLMPWTWKLSSTGVQRFVQAHQDCKYFTSCWGHHPGWGRLVLGQLWSLGQAISELPTKYHVDVPCDLTAGVNQFIYVNSWLRHVCTYWREGKKENRKDKGRKRRDGSSRESTEKRWGFVDLWFQKPSLMMCEREYFLSCYCHLLLLTCWEHFVSHRPPKHSSLQIPLALIYISCLGQFYFSYILLFT